MKKSDSLFGLLFISNFLSVRGSRPVACDIADSLDSQRWKVLRVSHFQNPLLRIFHMLTAVLFLRTQYHAAVLDVYSGRAFLWAEVLSKVLKWLGCPFVCVLHGGDLPYFFEKNIKRVSHVLQSANQVVAPSEYLKKALSECRKDIQVIPNGLFLSRYRRRSLSKVEPKLIWLRAFHEVYNPVMALEVAGDLIQDFPDLKLWMVGPDKKDGSLEKAKQKAAQLGIEKNVSFVGAVSKEEVPSWLHRANLFLNTTDIDNTPVTVIEAMACGLCVVSTDVGGVPHLIEDGKEALLVSPRRKDLMVGAVKKILKDSGLSQALSQNARSKAEQFDLNHIAPQWEKLLIHLVKGNA